jgi:Beta-propeller repeat
MKKLTILVVALLCLPALAATSRVPSVNDSGSHPQSTAITAAKSGPDRENQAKMRAAYATLPLSFVPNAGQMDSRVRYSAQSGGATFYFTTRDAVFSFASKARGLVLRLGFLGANPRPAITGRTPQSGRVNYLIGNDPARWHTNLATYGEVVYRDLWPSIDLLFRSENGKLEYEFLVKPGARVQDIRLAYHGADKLSVDHDGELVVHTKVGSITDKRPVTYQLVDGKRVLVASRFALERRENSKTSYGFAIGNYDRRRALVIDPGLVYSTFLGGTQDDAGNGIAVDSAGQAYVTGLTYSVDFPTTAGAYDTTFNGDSGYPFGGGDVFVSKLNSKGSALVYSTYLGGTLDEPIWAASIAVDSSGNAYLTGTTDSPDFPITPGAFQSTLKGIQDAYVVKLNHNGNLVYSTFLGGTGQNGAYYASAIAVDCNGNAYVTGFTDSVDFPTTPGAFQTTFQGPFYDAFVTKLNSKGTGLVYSTYLGGSSDDDATSIAVDSAGKALVTGYTSSANFPTTPGAVQPNIGGGYDAFVTKLNSSGSALVYSTFLGGTNDDAGGAITIDWSGKAYITGYTISTNYPTTPGAYQTTTSGGYDGFVTKLNTNGTALVYSTYLGGLLDDEGVGIAVDSAGQAHVTGQTDSLNFPVTADAYQPINNGSWDAFVTKLNSTGSALVYSTYLGGAVDDFGYGVSLGRSGNVYVTGSTNSANFPATSGAFETTYNGGLYYGDAFVTKLSVPQGAPGCHKGDGDGDAQDKSSGKKSHFHFHKRSDCDDPNDKENDNVESNDDSGSNFQSSSVNSSTYSIQDSSQVITLTGTGTHNGLPVSFTMVGVNYGDVAPGIFQITLTDGYVFNGLLLDGNINIQ